MPSPPLPSGPAANRPGGGAGVAVCVPLARLGDIARAQKFNDELATAFPTDTLLMKVSLPAIQAAIELQRNQPQKAIAALESFLK